MADPATTPPRAGAALQFAFHTAPRILFGNGLFAEVGTEAARFGKRVALVSGGRSLEASGRLDQLTQQLRAQGIEWTHLKIDREPTTERITALSDLARSFDADFVVAVGGGSVLDAGKALAALLTNPGDVLDYLEGVGKGKPVAQPAAPMIAVPTTAGTGSEVTKNAVISDEARTYKKSMRSEGMIPRVALVDPELLSGCPAAVTAACGMDALTQCLEAFTSSRANPLTDALAAEGLDRASALATLRDDPANPKAQESMALASLLGGICLANAGLGAVHGLASPLGAFFPIPHGAVCAALLPAVIRVNVERAIEAGLSTLLNKYCQAYGLLASVPGRIHRPAEIDSPHAALMLSDGLRFLNTQLQIPGLGHWGVTPDDFDRIVAGGRGSSMKTNPIMLCDDDLRRILEMSL